MLKKIKISQKLIAISINKYIIFNCGWYGWFIKYEKIE